LAAPRQLMTHIVRQMLCGNTTKAASVALAFRLRKD